MSKYFACEGWQDLVNNKNTGWSLPIHQIDPPPSSFSEVSISYTNAYAPTLEKLISELIKASGVVDFPFHIEKENQ